MTFTDRNFTSTDFTAQKQQISEEGLFPLTFVGLTFHPERIFEENGEEKRQAGRIEADFINDVGEFATVRYYEFRYTQIFNLIEYMANMGYFQGFPDDFTFEAFENLPTAEKVQLVNNLKKIKLKKITVLSESRVSTSGNEYFAYDIAQEVTDSVDKQQSDDLTILVPQATETVSAQSSHATPDFGSDSDPFSGSTPMNLSNEDLPF